MTEQKDALDIRYEYEINQAKYASKNNNYGAVKHWTSAAYETATEIHELETQRDV
jgi:hypothetical protein